MIEVSHFTGSVVGVVLLLVSQGLSRRLDAAYYMAVGRDRVGIVTAMLKGLDYEEATLLAFVLLLMVRARPAFDRRAAFFETRFSPAWVATVLGALGASVWLGFFAFKHVEYSRRAVVAVRAARRGVALPARLGRAPPSSRCCSAWRGWCGRRRTK